MNKTLGITLPISLGLRGYFDTTADPMEQIKSNLINLLLTQKGERPFQPTFGCDIPRVLFESNTDSNLAEIHAIIQTAVELWLPFVRIDEVHLNKSATDEHSVSVTVDYTVTTLNMTGSMTLTF